MMRTISLSVLALLSAGCIESVSETRDSDIQAELLETDRRSLKGDDAPLSGVWKSRGFGWLIEQSPEGQQVYEVGDFGCYPRPKSISNATEMLSFEYEDYHVLENGETAMFMLRPDKVGPVFDRIDGLPVACAETPESSPANTLDVFLDFMTTHYAHFERRGVDWTALAEDAHSLFNADPSEAGLKSAMAKVITTLQDSHTRIITIDETGNSERISGGEGETLPMINQKNAQGAWLGGILSQLGTDILDDGAQHVGNDRILWGTIDKEIGYLQVFTMGGFTETALDDPDWAESELREMDRILDEAFGHFSELGVKAVILDLSNNRGGYDEVSRQLAARFTDEAFFAYSTHAKGSGLDILRKTIEPAADHRFAGPTYVLTSDVTVSGGEIATLALRQLPNVTQVGQPTRGSFSTALPKALPNGWILELANETFADPAGQVYAGRGLPPETEIEVFKSDDPVASHGEAINEIVQLIRSS